MDIKSIGLGAIIGFLAGGGLYGAYVKNIGEANFTQAVGHGDVLKCFSLIGSNNSDKIEAFLNSLPEKEKKLAKSDAIATIVSSAASGDPELKGMGQPLRDCAKTLTEKFEALNITSN